MFTYYIFSHIIMIEINYAVLMQTCSVIKLINPFYNSDLFIVKGAVFMCI